MGGADLVDRLCRSGLAVLGVTNVVIILGGVMVLVGSGWNAKGFGKVTAVFGSLYNHVTGYFGTSSPILVSWP